MSDAPNVRPMGTKLLVRVLKSPIMYKRLLHLPDPSNHRQSNNGVVYACGPRVTSIVPGEWVVYNRLFAQEVDDDHVIVDSTKCIAVLASDHEVAVSVYLAVPPFMSAAETEAWSEPLRSAGIIVVNDKKGAQQWRQDIVRAECFVVLESIYSLGIQCGYALAQGKPLYTPYAPPRYLGIDAVVYKDCTDLSELLLARRQKGGGNDGAL